MSALGMPPHMLALFEARPPLEHLPFPDTRLRRKPGSMAEYVKEFSHEKLIPDPHFETPKERRARKLKEKINAHLALQKQLIEEYDPQVGNSLTHDPYKTLFIGNLDYEATERQIRTEFEAFGKIKRIRIIADAKGNPRGYAFIEFSTEREMVNAYKRGDGRKIAGRRVIVDVERARTVPGWLPRRLGGGRGKPRGAKKIESPREPDRQSSEFGNRAGSASRPRDYEQPKGGYLRADYGKRPFSDRDRNGYSNPRRDIERFTHRSSNQTEWHTARDSFDHHEKRAFRDNYQRDSDRGYQGERDYKRHRF